jgi:hypothetical protein
MDPKNIDKWRYSLYSAILFFILSLPCVYNLTSYIIKTINDNGCPMILGILIHSVVFLLIVRVMMEIKHI